MASPYDIPAATTTNPYNIGSSSPVAAPAAPITGAPAPAAPAAQSWLTNLGGVGGSSVIDGIKGVVQQFVQGAVGGAKAQQAAAPAPASFSQMITGGPKSPVAVGAASLSSTLSDSWNKAKAAYDAYTTPTTGAQKVNATGEGLLGALNVLFTPITTTLAAVSAVPGVGYIADAVNDIFAGISGGATNVASHAVDNAVGVGLLSPQTAASIKPLVTDTAALVAQIIAGKGGEYAGTAVLDKTHQIVTAVADHISMMDPKQLQGGYIRNPFASEPSGSAAKGEVGQLAVEKDPTKIAQTLRDMGVQGDIADAFAPKIAAETDPTKISDILQTVKGAQNLADGDHIETTPQETDTQNGSTEPQNSEQTPLAKQDIQESAPAEENPTPATDPKAEPFLQVAEKFKNGNDLGQELRTFDSSLETARLRGFKTLAEFYNSPDAHGALRPALYEELKDVPNTSTEAFKGTPNELLKLSQDAAARGPIPVEPTNTSSSATAEKPLEIPGKNEPAPMTHIKEILDKKELPPAPAKDDKISTPGDFITELPKAEQDGLKPLVRDIAAKTGAKVHLLDYLATPEYVLEKIGLGKQAKDLRTAFENYVDNKKTELTKVQEWKDRVAGTPDNARTIFQYLDGQEKEVKPLMTDTEYEVAREIRDYLSKWADRLELPNDSRIARYITHLFEPSAAAEKEGANIFDDPELAAMMRDKVAGSVYDPFLEKRLGKQGYKQDVWAALDAYVKRATRKEAMDPALEKLEFASKRLDEQSYNYVVKLSHRINMRPTEFEKLVDNLIKSSRIGSRYGDRPIAYLSNKIRSLFYRGTIGLNFSSAVRNLTQGVNTYAKLGEKYTVIGYSKLVYRLMSRNIGELYDNHVLDGDFVQDKKVGVYKTALQKLDPVLYGVFETAEMINRGAAYFGAKSKAIAEGKNEADAVDYAKRMVRETQFTFSSIDTPVALNDDAVKTLTQLQTYSIKQIEFLMRMAKNKEFGGLIRYSLASYVAVNTIGKLFGMNLLQQLLPTVGVGGSPLGTLASNLAGLTSSNSQTQASAKTGLQNQLWTLFPAGGQIHKTIQGLEAYNAGKDVTATGRTRFNVPHNLPTLIRATLFGKNNLPQAQAYYNSLGKKKATSASPYNR